jgi:methyl-accepting chemotaxis protein
MTVIFGALLSMAVVFFYNFFTAEKISYNIKLLLKSIENMHKDRFDSTPQSTTPDEFGEISRSVYHLGLKMQKSAEELQQERFFRVEAESERGEKEARLRQLNAQIDSLVLATKQMRVSIPDENPYSIDGAEPSSSTSIKELAQELDKTFKVQEDKTHQTVELCRNLDERLLLIQERSKNLENRTDAFVNLSNEILTEVSMMDHATGGGDTHTSEQIRKNSTSLKNLVNKVMQLVLSIQSGCDETGLNAERGLRALRDAVARLDDGSSREQREAKDRLVQTALKYVKAYQATVDRDRRLWNRYVDISHHAQQVELISRHISKTMDYTEEPQSDTVAGNDAMVPRAS